MHKGRVHLLYFTAEQWPTFRPDLVALFGKFLPRYGVTCDLVTERDLATEDRSTVPWGGGRTIVCGVPHNRVGQYLIKFWHNLRILISFDAQEYDAIQVRDMSITALLGLLSARIKGLPFYYWLSFPQSEGQIDRAMARGIKAGMRFWFPLFQGIFGKWVLYKIVLPKSDHVFVQSRQMQLELSKQGIPMLHMTPVPMGVDTEAASAGRILPSDDVRLVGRRVLVYLGTLDKERKIEILFEMLVNIKSVFPNVLLVLVGDTQDLTHREWLRQQAASLDVLDHVLWTGWLDSSTAWCYAKAAEIGLSPIPRGYILDLGSPTKAVEYMALGLPVVCNDNPDQKQVITESGAGICVPLQGDTFAEAVIGLLKAPAAMREMGLNGREYVTRKRGYNSISRMVAALYRDADVVELQAEGHL